MEFDFGQFSIAIVAVMLLLFGMVIGTKLGGTLAKSCVTHKDFWLSNLKILGLGACVSALIFATKYFVLAGIPIGAMAAGIAVLKMDFGESVGAWKWHDAHFRVNKDQLARSKTAQSRAHAEACRRARAHGEAMPEVISVVSPSSLQDASSHTSRTSQRT